MSRKVTGAFAVMLGCGVALLGLLPKAPGRYARRTTLERSATRPGVVDAGLEARVREALRSAPLAFEANLGQTDEQVKFTAGGAGYTLFLTGEEAVIALHRPFAREKKPVYLEERAQGWHAGEPMSAVLRLKFIGASATTRLTGIDEQPARTNYFIGNDESRWRRNVPNYREVRYENLYPGVDAVFYGDRRTLEYDFVVKPGADPRVITLGFEGARNLKLSPAGELAAETPLGEVRLLQPRVYQETISGARVPVAGKYVQRGEGLIGFELAGYDAGRAVVIDPPVSVMPRMLASPPPPPGPPTPTGSALQLGTYLGGQFDEAINAIAVGSNGQVYVAGFSDSFSGFPAAGTPFQGFNAGAFDCSQFPQHPCGDAFVATLNTTTGALVATTFLGGGADDVAWGLALDSANDPYVVGESDSGNFPTTAATAFQATPGNASCASGSRTRPCRHAFFSKLTPNLSSLTYSTFLAGTDDDSAFAVAVDPSGNAFITGVAGFGFTTVTPASGAYSGAGDAFVARVDPTASGTGSLIYATYIGGSGTDEGLAIAVDVNGNASIGGATFSTVNTSVAFPTTINAVQAGSSDASFCGPGGGFNCGDGFIAQVDATGTLTYASFFGGDSTDQVNGIALDAAGNIFVTGATSSHSIPIPTTPGAFDTAGSSGFDAFAAKINPAAAGLAGVTYSTFLAGSNDDSGNAIAIDPSGNAFIAGTTNSTDYPTFLALQAASRVGFFSQTSFVTSLNAAGSALNFSTYYGGTNTETGRAVAIDAAGLIYAGGSTNSTDLCTAKAFQPQNNSQFGTADAFLTIINPTNTAAVCVMMTNGTMPPGPVDFGQVDVGTTSFPQTVDLFNAGSAAMTF
ncbi:MAG TPA: SBBP repeat-containing protein, partial [Candidatus Acidoferrum sp.]|nr:SBBP repeat-containing protein [Candidatus Acidoferrum sp.]